MTAMWRGYRGGPTDGPEQIDTRIARPLLESIAQAMTEIPQGFTPHPKIVRLLEQRSQMGRGEKPLDWGMAELLAYGSLLYQHVNVLARHVQPPSRGDHRHREWPRAPRARPAAPRAGPVPHL